jgi:hypothetical protein
MKIKKNDIEIKKRKIKKEEEEEELRYSYD